LGAEVSVTTDLSRIQGVEKLAIEGTDYILVEMPYSFWHNWMYESLFKLMTEKRLIPIIAHIERYYNAKDNSQIVNLAQLDVYFQVNASSIVHNEQFKFVMRLINNNYVYFLGSDAHNNDDRSVSMKKAVEILKRKVSGKFVQFLMVNARMMLDNKIVEKSEATYVPKYNVSLWNRLFRGGLI
jgi:protein-tyrosine phosphatase